MMQFQIQREISAIHPEAFQQNPSPDQVQSLNFKAWNTQNWQRAILLRLSIDVGMLTDYCFIPFAGPEPQLYNKLVGIYLNLGL
jgi:hypothetical protein